MTRLSAVFVQHIEQDRRGLSEAERTELDGTLELLLRQARASWPDAEVDDATFLRHLAERLPPDGTVREAVERMHVGDLLLACACEHSDRAVTVFRGRYFGEIRAAAGRAVPSELTDEVGQRVMTKLFVGTAASGPVIGRYGGRGSLGGWLQVLTTREARNALRSVKALREQPDADRLADLAMDTGGDPELDELKRVYRAQFKLAFHAAFDELSVRERNTLRHEHLDHLDGAQIGAVYGVNKSTVSRWRASARQKLLEGTRAFAERELNLAPREFDSVMRLINSQLDVSLSRILREDDTRVPPDDQ
jgi:RNA polymerase sigma-70 factor, ECF subfamily